MPFVRRRPLLRMAAVGGVAYMGAKAGTNKAMQAQQAQGQAQGQGATAAPPPAARHRHRPPPRRQPHPPPRQRRPHRRVETIRSPSSSNWPSSTSRGR